MANQVPNKMPLVSQFLKTQPLHLPALEEDNDGFFNQKKKRSPKYVQMQPKSCSRGEF